VIFYLYYFHQPAPSSRATSSR